jgi:RNA polymerase sigma factor (sigma-70 family)
MNEPKKAGHTANREIAALLAGRDALVEWLCARAGVSRWGVPRERFAEALARSAAKHFAGKIPSAEQMEDYFHGLHLEELALACACAEGREAAWEHFVSGYRSGLRAAAAAIVGRTAHSAEACELADTLFAELYGLDRRGRGRDSLFCYYHGRSKLSTWLRAVLAQRHVDAIRSGRRFEPLEEGESGKHASGTTDASPPPLLDPDRPRYLALLQQAFAIALGRLEVRDRQRLSLYYIEGQTLAQIGNRLGEHESSVSRNLDRIRKELRGEVEGLLRRGEGPVDGSPARPGLSDAQIALCFEYALQDGSLDLGKALGPLRDVSGKRSKS